MVTSLQASREMVEEVAALHFPPRTDRLLQSLMDRINDCMLSPEEHDEMESLVELSESISPARAKAFDASGRQPG